jgi:hypothetical protein
MYAVHKLLWDVRREPALADRFRADPDALLDDYGLTGEDRAAMRSLDVKRLYEAGANPYLLYFCALQLGMARNEYYARIRGERR